MVILCDQAFILPQWFHWPKIRNSDKMPRQNLALSCEIKLWWNCEYLHSAARLTSPTVLIKLHKGISISIPAVMCRILTSVARAPHSNCCFHDKIFPVCAALVWPRRSLLSTQPAIHITYQPYIHLYRPMWIHLLLLQSSVYRAFGNALVIEMSGWCHTMRDTYLDRISLWREELSVSSQLCT